MLHPPLLFDKDRLSREQAIRSFTETAKEPDDVWIYGDPAGKTNELHISEYAQVKDMIPKQWGTNVFLVPLMLVKIRRQARVLKILKRPSFRLHRETWRICLEVEYATQYLLPVLRSLFPDSQQRWGPEEVCSLLAAVDYRKLDGHKSDGNDGVLHGDEMRRYQPNAWEQHCPTFWMMFKDCFAETPGLLDVLQDTIDRMEASGVKVVAEDPDAPTVAEFSECISYMAERQRANKKSNSTCGSKRF